MNPQLPLFGADANVSPLGELFFALLPDDKAVASIAALAQQLHEKYRIKGTLINRERFHVTLHHVGTYAGLPDSIVLAAQQAGESVTAAPFETAFDRVFSFSGGPKRIPSVLGMEKENAELTAFQLALKQALILAGFSRWLMPAFTPHLTLFYGRTAIADQPIPMIGWTAREFVLIHSQPGKGHKRLGCWPLR